jgi:polysaccharide deacetylase 2 family uncharacterized protein YibQ
MSLPVRNRSRKKPSGSRVAALVILVLVAGAIVAYYFFSPPGNTGLTHQKPELSHVNPGVPGASIPQSVGNEPPDIPQPPQKEQRNHPLTTVYPGTEKPESVVGTSGYLAIIIDDMGSNLSEARSLAAIKVPLTFSIIPGLRVDKDVAAYAATNKIETMIHIPMQSKGWPARRLEVNGLLVSMDSDELQERVSAFVQRFPGAVGANNHMGSEFTEQKEKMGAVLTILKKNNLFFVDSITSPESTGLEMAQQLGVKSARRNVFLDNELDRGYILGQLNQAVKLARKNGSAIAICHPHPATISALAAALPGVAGQGVLLVPVSQLVR